MEGGRSGEGVTERRPRKHFLIMVSLYKVFSHVCSCRHVKILRLRYVVVNTVKVALLKHGNKNCSMSSLSGSVPTAV